MPLYQYIKENKSRKRKALHMASFVSLFAGAMLLFWSFYPIISFEIYSRLFIDKQLNTPVPSTNVASSLAKANSVLGSHSVFSNNIRDFTQASLWFPTFKQNATLVNSPVKNYTLSIPKLGLKDVNVAVGGEDLAKSLVHYQPRSLPGEYGNVVIFGHSTLPQLYNVKDYKTIFTYLPSLDKGDEIDVMIAGTKYRYDVVDMFVVKPDQVSVLEEESDASYITLITCVPPGTLWNRLVVKARLSNLKNF